MKHFIRLQLLAIIFTVCTTANAQWNQIGIDIDGEGSDDWSGHSVGINSDGSTIAIGAYKNNGNGSDAGHVRVYKWMSGAWSQLGSDIDGETAGDWSGISVDISSDGLTVAIGAPENDGNGSQSGHTRIYKYNGTSWIQQGTDIDGDAVSDWLGRSVSLSSDGLTIAIGAPYNSSNGNESGQVKIYKLISGTWIQLGTDINGESINDLSGFEVDLSSDGLTVAIGAPYNNGNGINAGHVRVYKWISGAWFQQGADINGEASEDWSGRSVSLSSNGSTIAIGASGNDGNGSGAGHVRVYKWVSGAWSQQGSDIDGEMAGDWSGQSVSLSSDGLTVAIGATENDENGTDCGHTRIYKFNGTSWIQQGTDIDGESANDGSGRSVSLSSDGLTLAIGAMWNDGNGSNAGHVRVYSYTNPVNIKEDLLFENMSIFPNPNQGMININLGETKSNLMVTLTNNLGQIILTQKFKSTNHINLDVNGPKGIYFLQLKTVDGETKTIKILKE